MAVSAFVVTRERGSTWNHALGMREQEQWAEHAAFIDGLADDRFVVLGGPVGNGSHVLLIVKAESEEAIRTRLDGDPWTPMGLLTTKAIEPWEILLGEIRC